MSPATATYISSDSEKAPGSEQEMEEGLSDEEQTAESLPPARWTAQAIRKRINRAREKQNQMTVRNEDDLPAYLSPEQIFVYFPEDLQYGNLLGILHTFDKKCIASRIGLELSSIRSREDVARRHYAGLLEEELAAFKKTTVKGRKPISKEAGEAAATLATGIMNDQSFPHKRAMHQTLAAVFFQSLNEAHTHQNPFHKSITLLKTICVGDVRCSKWGSMCRFIAEFQAKQEDWDGQKLSEDEWEEISSEALGLLAEWAETDVRRAAFVIRYFYEYLRKLPDSEVKQRVVIIEKCVECLEERSVVKLDCWPEIDDETEYSAEEAALSAEKLVVRLGPGRELTAHDDALIALQLLREIHFANGGRMHDVAGIRKIFKDHGISRPAEISKRTWKTLEGDTTSSRGVAVSLLDAVGDYVLQQGNDAVDDVCLCLWKYMASMWKVTDGSGEAEED